ncbi:MAG: hypothetical protein ACJAU0_000371 [Flavobacteriales bacterium]|jgi:hypothetical protein
MKAMENNRLIVLAPHKSSITNEILKPQLFDVRIYRTAEDAWCLAEKEHISLFISYEKFILGSPAGFIPALFGLHPELVHLFFYSDITVEELATLVNASSNIHLATINAPKKALLKAADEAMESYLKGAQKSQIITELTEQNEQYEFMLRQSMLS